MKEFLINSRSRAVLDLIDAFELTESELVDIRDGVYNRVSELRNNLTVGDVTCECYRCKGLGAIHMTDDTADDTCPVCDGSGELICDEGDLEFENSLVENSLEEYEELKKVNLDKLGIEVTYLDAEGEEETLRNLDEVWNGIVNQVNEKMNDEIKIEMM
jgi:hypothetical protein